MDKWIPSNRSTEYAVRTIARLHRLHINKATLLIVFVHAWYKLVYNKPFCFARVTLYYSSNIVIYKDVYQIIWILKNVPIFKNIIAISTYFNLIIGLPLSNDYIHKQIFILLIIILTFKWSNSRNVAKRLSNKLQIIC